MPHVCAAPTVVPLLLNCAVHKLVIQLEIKLSHWLRSLVNGVIAAAVLLSLDMYYEQVGKNITLRQHL